MTSTPPPQRGTPARPSRLSREFIIEQLDWILADADRRADNWPTAILVASLRRSIRKRDRLDEILDGLDAFDRLEQLPEALDQVQREFG